MLPHWGRVTHICVGNLTSIGSHNGMSPRRPLLSHCWNIVNWTLRNQLQRNFNRNSYIFIQEHAFENVVCKKAAILSWLQCVKVSIPFMIKQKQDVYDYATKNNKYTVSRLDMIYMLVQFNYLEMNKTLNTLHTYQQHLYWFDIVEMLGRLISFTGIWCHD